MKFKVGDRVKIIGSHDCYGDIFDNTIHLIGSTTTITEITDDEQLPYVLAVDNRNWSEQDLELVTREKTIMSTLGDKVKLIRMKPNQRKLYKQGFTDGCGDLTSEGKEALWSVLLEEYEPKLVELADQIKAEEDKKK